MKLGSSVNHYATAPLTLHATLVQPVKKNIYEGNTYKKDLSWLHFVNESGVLERQQVKMKQFTIPFL